MEYNQVLEALISNGINTGEGGFVREGTEDYETLHNKHDKGYKYLLSAKKVFIQLLRTFVKQGWVANIEEQNILRLDKSFILQDFNEKEADLVYLVKLDNKPVIFYILMELQSTVDFKMPYRLLLYMVEIWRSIVKDETNNTQTKEFKLPPVIPIVLYNGAGNWTARRSFGEYQYEAESYAPYIVDFRYLLIDVNRYSEKELLRAANLIATVFYLDREDDPEKLVRKLRKIFDAVKNFRQEEMSLFKNWLLHAFARGVEPVVYQEIKQIVSENPEVEDMITNLENTLRRGYDVYLAKGVEKGRREGRLEGRREVALKMLRKGSKVSFISEVTGLTREEIGRLTEKHQENTE